jgi:hypothetical protein
MSHFTVLVIGDDVEGQLAPYHEFECTGRDDQYVQNIDRLAEAREGFASSGGNGETFVQWVEGWYGWRPVPEGEEPDLAGEHKYGWYRLTADGDVTEAIDRTNPNRKWDWWVIGGRWTGHFKLKPGASGVAGRPGLFADRAEPGYADQARKGDIDFDAMRDEAGHKAGERYDRARALIGEHPIRTWDEVREAHPGEIEAARKEFWGQPAAVALKADRDLAWDGPSEFAVSREEYVEKARRGAVRTFALVKDGQWYERGKMGWFACVSGEKDEAEWDQEFAALLDGLPNDTLLTVVDCHI